MGRLLDLPDELIDPIINELQFLHVAGNGRDLLSYERRDTNRTKKDLQSLSYTSKRLRSLCVPHLQRHPTRVKKGAFTPRTKSLHLVGDREIHRLPKAALNSLVSLTLQGKPWIDTINPDAEYDSPISSHFIRGIDNMSALRTLVLKNLRLEEDAVCKMLRLVAAAPTLQHLTLDMLLELDEEENLASECESDCESHYESEWFPVRSLPPALLSLGWTAPLTRLEIRTIDLVSLEWFLAMMQHFASTLQIAILHVKTTDPDYDNDDEYGAGTRTLEEFDALWRFAFSSDVPADECYYDLSICTIIDIWSHAPELACLECSRRLRVRGPEELQQITDLRNKGKLEYARVKLDTWDGPKGQEWTDATRQEIMIG